MDNQQFGSRLRKYRFMRHLSEAQLAAKADITYNYVCRLEAGKATPTLEMLMKLTVALGITSNCLVYDDEPIQTDDLSSVSYYKIETLDKNQVHMLKTIMDAVFESIENKHTYTVGKRIQKVRESRGIPSTVLSKMLQLSSGYIRNIEYGNSKVSIATLEKICEALNVDINYLICDNAKETEIYVLNDMIKRSKQFMKPDDYNFAKLLYNYIIGGFAATDDGK